MMYLHKPSTHNNAVKGGGGKKRKNKEADKIEHAWGSSRCLKWDKLSVRYSLASAWISNRMDTIQVLNIVITANAAQNKVNMDRL